MVKFFQTCGESCVLFQCWHALHHISSGINGLKVIDLIPLLASKSLPLEEWGKQKSISKDNALSHEARMARLLSNITSSRE